MGERWRMEGGRVAGGMGRRRHIRRRFMRASSEAPAISAFSGSSRSSALKATASPSLLLSSALPILHQPGMDGWMDG